MPKAIAISLCSVRKKTKTAAKINEALIIRTGRMDGPYDGTQDDSASRPGPHSPFTIRRASGDFGPSAPKRPQGDAALGPPHRSLLRRARPAQETRHETCDTHSGALWLYRSGGAWIECEALRSQVARSIDNAPLRDQR